MSRERATFRTPLPPLGGPLLVGALAGAAAGLAAEAPPLLLALFGAVAAWVAIAARHAAGPRLTADAEGLHAEGGPVGAGLSGRWEELRLGFGFAHREDGAAQRYAIVADPRGRSFAFTDLAGAPPCRPVPGADGRPVPVVYLREAPLLLGLLVQRGPAWHVLPDGLQGRSAVLAPLTPEAEAQPARPARSSPRVGLWGLLATLGTKLLGGLSKLGTGALKAVKATNLGWAAASAAAYSMIFSWKFALAIMLQLFVHEYGHVHAMRRTGMKVRGMYFIPFLGAVAVTEDQFKSRRQQAYVALNGPLWGSILIVLPAGLYLATGDPIFAAVAAWWALLNLFNLLPIAPLDGGRLMQAFAFSYSSSLGLAVSVLGLFGAVALAHTLGFSLVWLLAVLGVMELVSESQARAGARALRLLPEPARFGEEQWVYLRAVLGPPPGGPDEGAYLVGLDRAERAARAEPLTGDQMARWGLAYAGLAVVLVLVVWMLGHVPGADIAAKVLE